MDFDQDGVVSPKDADRMTNCVDTDQAARSSLIWVYTVCPGLSVRKLKIITVSCMRYILSVSMPLGVGDLLRLVALSFTELVAKVILSIMND